MITALCILAFFYEIKIPRWLWIWGIADVIITLPRTIEDTVYVFNKYF